jgi:hypothetical protein
MCCWISNDKRRCVEAYVQIDRIQVDSFWIARDPAGTDGRGIADRFRMPTVKTQIHASHHCANLVAAEFKLFRKQIFIQR